LKINELEQVNSQQRIIISKYEFDKNMMEDNTTMREFINKNYDVISKLADRPNYSGNDRFLKMLEKIKNHNSRNLMTSTPEMTMISSFDTSPAMISMEA
jgi:hypothetical protein